MLTHRSHDCIYCLRRLEADAFNREHVLSEAFGTFEDALVLHYCVCQECNDAFGNQLEVKFARGAFEGLLRYQRGIKPVPGEGLRLRFVELAIPEGNGDWSGVRLRLVRGTDGLHVDLLPQAAFFDKNTETWVHLTEGDIRMGELATRPNFKNGPIRVYARSTNEYNSLVSLLRDNGINFEKSGDLKPPDGLLEAPNMEVEVSFTINKGVRRCIAKYAFNYLTYICGSAFVLGSDFDTTRRLIRYGDQPDYPLVVAGSRPILYDDRASARQTDGHLITLSWAESMSDLVGEVSLFNSITYRVSLCRRFSGDIWRPFQSGHHYNIHTRKVEKLVGFSRHIALFA